MDSIEFVVLAEALTGILISVLYVPVCLFSFWRLMPRLSPTSKRLAIFMLTAQVLVIMLSFVFLRASDNVHWLWNLDSEWNVPATLASMQLVLVSGVALFTAWYARERPVWQRIYLVAISLLFLYFARDEYFKVHENIKNWNRYYVAIGALVAAATLAVAARSPRHLWIWHVCLLAGLGIAAVGSVVLEELQDYIVCGSWGLMRLIGCLKLFAVEESLEFVGIWLALVGMLGQFSDVVPRPSPHVRRFLYALPALWFFLLVREVHIPRLELELMAKPASVHFESELHVRGFRVHSDRAGVFVRLYASAKWRDFTWLGYVIGLVDQATGDTIASQSQYMKDHRANARSPGFVHLYRHSMDIRIPPQAPVNRALWVVLSVWREEGGAFVTQEVTESDLQLLDDTQVVLGELVLPAVSADTSTAALAVFDKGFALETVDMPERAQAGETLRIPFSWRSDEDARADHLQFLQFGNVESGDWWVYDQQPLSTRLPTRLWYSGLADTELWEVRIPADLSPGRYEVFTGLYRTRDLERVPARDADGVAWLDGRVLLGNLIIE